MAVKQGTQGIPVDTLRIDAFSGGMNTSGEPIDILPNECSLIENLEFDDLDNLVTRNGISIVFPSVLGISGSVFSFNTESGFVGILATPGAAIISYTLTGTATPITGALVLPSNVRWYWKSLNNVAVGVNGSTGNGNPIQVVGPAPGTASHLAAAPDGKFIEEWGSRLWIVHVANPNRLQCSDLGSATSWNTGGLTNPAQGIILDVAAGDGDVITGLFAFKERLFIFKRKRIYVLRVTALPETDPNNWERVEYANNIGCINQSTIREVFDDVVFLSEGGLVSLAAAEKTADFSSAIISAKISEIQRIKKDSPETSICAFALPDRSQYWLSVDSIASPTGKSVIWVMDYKQINKGIRWVTFTFRGDIFNVPITAIEQHKVAQNQNVYILAITTGAASDSSTLAIYTPNTPVVQRSFKDSIAGGIVTPIIQRINTKAFDFDLEDIRKLMKYWYLRVNVLTRKVKFNITYEQNDPLEPRVNYEFDVYPLGFNRERLFRQAFYHGASRKMLNVRFLMTFGGEIDQGVSIKSFGINYAVLTERRSEDMLITTTFRNVLTAIERNFTLSGNVGGGVQTLFDYDLPFGTLRADGDFVKVISGGGLAANDNQKGINLVVDGEFVTGVAPVDLDGASGSESWNLETYILRQDSTHVIVTARAIIGQFFADGAGTFSSTNGLIKGDNRVLTVPDLDLNDLSISITGQGTANNDVTHRNTIIEISQQ